MRKFYLTAYFIIFFCLHILAQKNGTVKGIAFDTSARQPVSSATITVELKKDSSLVSFTMTDSKGYFEVRGIANGEYRLLITHISYHNSNRYFTNNNNHKNVDSRKDRHD